MKSIGELILLASDAFFLAELSLLFDSKEPYLIRLNLSSARVRRTGRGCPLHVRRMRRGRKSEVRPPHATGGNSVKNLRFVLRASSALSGFMDFSCFAVSNSGKCPPPCLVSLNLAVLQSVTQENVLRLVWFHWLQLFCSQ